MIQLPTTSDIPNPKGQGYGAIIDDLPLRLAPSERQPVRVQSARAQAQQINTSESPEEFISDVGRTFAISDATGGEGLLLRHRRNRQETDAVRYWDSRGLRIQRAEFGETNQIGLLEKTEGVIGAGGDYDGSYPVEFGGILYARANPSGFFIARVVNPGGTPTVTFEDPLVNDNIEGIAAFAGKLYVSGGITRIRQGTGATPTYADAAHGLPTGGIWEARDRLIFESGNTLREWDGVSATAPTILTLISGVTVTSVVAGPDAIYASTSNGVVYAFRPNEAGVLVLSGQTTFQGERIDLLRASQGLVFVSTRPAGQSSFDETNGRLWVMQPNNDGSLSGSVVREWEFGSPLHGVVDRESAYFMVTDNAEETRISVWRYDVVSAAMHRWWDIRTTTASFSRGYSLFKGRHYFGVFTDGLGGGLQRVSSELEDEGFIITPLADFFTSEAKTWVQASINLGLTPQGGSAEIYYTTVAEAMTDNLDPQWRLVAQTTDDRENIPLVGVESRQLAVQVRLRRGTSATETPTLQSVAARALLATTDLLVTLPVVVSDVTERPYKRALRIPGYGEAVYAALVGKERASVALEVFSPPVSIRGQVEAVDTPSPMRSRRGTALRVAEVVIRGRRAALAGTSTGVGPAGSFIVGGQPAGGA